MLAVIFIITFIGIYSEYILARTLLRSADNLTLALGLQLFVSNDYSARWGNLSAAALIGAAPIVLTFLFAQRQIIRRPHPRCGQGLTARERSRRRRSGWMPISFSER